MEVTTRAMTTLTAWRWEKLTSTGQQHPNEPKQGTRATHFVRVRYEEIVLGKAAAQVMVLFAERGVKEGQEITWSYGDSYRSHRKALGYRAGTKADPNALTPQQARTAFARY